MNKKPVEFSKHVCKTCGNVFVGLYCNICGEKVIEAKTGRSRTSSVIF